jgi:hypothetical protein
MDWLSLVEASGAATSHSDAPRSNDIDPGLHRVAPAAPEPSRAARVTLSCIARGRRALEECSMRQSILVLFSALALAGCVSFSSSNPNPPPNSTVVVPRY